MHAYGLNACVPPNSYVKPLSPKRWYLEAGPGPAVPGILEARTLEWVAISSSSDLPNPGIKSMTPALAGGIFTTQPPGKPNSHPEPECKYKAVQFQFPTLHSNQSQRCLLGR